MPILNWLGKDKVINHHQDVPFRILNENYTYGDNTDGNMIIKGDNLHALKSLLPRYEGRVKCIYIDPPYNTGNEGWVYNDNVNDPKIRKWLGEVVGKEGEDLSRHDKWLCMMYPRLKLLHRLLDDDGAIFISIDDNEQANLKIICDEIFGANKFVGMLTWESTTQPDNAGKARFGLQKKTEPLLFYVMNKQSRNGYILRSAEVEKKYPHKGKFGACRFEIIEKSDAGDYNRPTMKFQILGQFPRKGKRWQIGEQVARELEIQGKVEIVNGMVKRAVYPEDELVDGTLVPFWSHLRADNVGTSQNGKKQLNDIFERDLGFDTVKPPALIEDLLSYFPKDSLILDSFAGSGTTAHAVLNLNKADGGNRKFILVEMEDYAETITAERVKRVIDGYGDTNGTGGGFGFYELGEQLLLENGNLNENIETEKIREYIWYTETKTAYEKQDVQYLLGVDNNTAYYFNYEKDKSTTLDLDFLKLIKTKAERYLVYADTCKLAQKDLTKFNIVYKKIPRDIKKF